MKPQKGIQSVGLTPLSSVQVPSNGVSGFPSLFKTAERTPDPNEESRLIGKRQNSSRKEKVSDKTGGRWTKAEHERFLEGRTMNKVSFEDLRKTLEAG